MEFKKEVIQIASREEILDAVEATLNELTNEFIQNPMRFFSEKDFHWYFCHLLNKKLIEKSLPNMSGLIETSFERNRGEYYKTMIVHQEYGTVGRKGKRIDVVVLDPEYAKRINGPNLELDKVFLRPLAAIEFGTEKNRELQKHIETDYQKLKESGAEKVYISIYYRDLTKSKKGQRFQKHLEKMNDIKDKVKEISKKPRLKVIGIIHYGNEYEKYEGGKWKKYPCVR